MSIRKVGQWSFCRNILLKRFSQNPEPETLHKYLSSNYPDDNYFSVYEAGFCGFWIHEKLTDLRINNDSCEFCGCPYNEQGEVT